MHHSLDLWLSSRRFSGAEAESEYDKLIAASAVVHHSLDLWLSSRRISGVNAPLILRKRCFSGAEAEAESEYDKLIAASAVVHHSL